MFTYSGNKDKSIIDRELLRRKYIRKRIKYELRVSGMNPVLTYKNTYVGITNTAYKKKTFIWKKKSVWSKYIHIFTIDSNDTADADSTKDAITKYLRTNAIFKNSYPVLLVTSVEVQNSNEIIARVMRENPGSVVVALPNEGIRPFANALSDVYKSYAKTTPPNASNKHKFLLTVLRATSEKTLIPMFIYNSSYFSH